MIAAADATRRSRVAGLALGALLALFAPGVAAEVRLQDLRVPEGFRVELVTDAVPNAREMALGRFADGKGNLYVGSNDAGKVYAVELAGGKATRVRTIASGLSLPTGVAWHDGALYVAAVSRILRFDGIDDRLAEPPPAFTVTDQLPSERHHGWKFIAFGPDGKLYVPVGAPCNVCLPDDRHALIQRLDLKSGTWETVARGVRNSVGFDWRPGDRSLWFTDNGRDMLGDDLPADELNHVGQNGQHFGFPYCHQGDSPDPEFGKERACRDFVAPVQKLGAHVAAIGMRFYAGSQFPPSYRGNVFIAEHGSWNRSSKSGYRISRVVLDGDGRATAYEPFMHGWLQGQQAWGRPADVLPLPDGSLLVSDDRAGAIYRVSYIGR